MEKRQLRIDVLGASFTIQSDESAEHLERVSAYLREKVEEVKARYSFATPLTLALLAALNIADELVKDVLDRPGLRSAPSRLRSMPGVKHPDRRQRRCHRLVRDPAPGYVVAIRGPVGADDAAGQNQAHPERVRRQAHCRRAASSHRASCDRRCEPRNHEPSPPGKIDALSSLVRSYVYRMPWTIARDQRESPGEEMLARPPQLVKMLPLLKKTARTSGSCLPSGGGRCETDGSRCEEASAVTSLTEAWNEYFVVS